MADAAQIMRAHGLGLVDECVTAARLEGLDIALAATILAKESGGKNIWGADGGLTVRTNGTYKPRTPVTRSAYLAYRAEMKAGRIIRQGCGPCQCTSAQYQDTADALGGCWDPVANMRSGFRGMGALIRAYGIQQGARRYNGSGPLAEKYGRDFLARHQVWKARLSGAVVSTGPVTVTPPAGTLITREETDVLVQPPVYWDGNRNFKAVGKAEAGAGSVFASAWAFVNSTWGDLTEVRVFANDGKGRTTQLSPSGGVVRNNTEYGVALPSGTRFFTVEGRAAHSTSIVTVSAICKPA